MTAKLYVTPLLDFPFSPGFNNKIVNPQVEIFREDTPQLLQTSINAWLTGFLDPAAPRMANLVSIEYQATSLQGLTTEYSALISYYLIGEP